MLGLGCLVQTFTLYGRSCLISRLMGFGDQSDTILIVKKRGLSRHQSLLAHNSNILTALFSRLFQMLYKTNHVWLSGGILGAWIVSHVIFLSSWINYHY